MVADQRSQGELRMTKSGEEGRREKGEKKKNLLLFLSIHSKCSNLALST